MESPLAALTEEVRARVRSDGVDLASDPGLVMRYARDGVRSWSERALAGHHPLLPDEASATRQLVAALAGFGILQPLLDDPDVEEVWINGPDAVFAASNGVAQRLPIRIDAAEIRRLVERMLSTTGRRVDLSSPFVDASLPDGSRLHVAIPDVARSWSLNVRKFQRTIRDLDSLVARGSLTSVAAEFLAESVRAGASILVSGATHSGKTTLLGALLASARPDDRIVTVEETFELDLRASDTVALQCRPPSLEGTGEVTLRRLIKEALRMRPDRIVVGEVREAEALDLLIALNAGLPGACSIHANGAAEALVKLATLPLLAGRNIDAAFIVPAVATTIDLVVHCRRRPDGSRVVAEIAAPTGRVVDGAPESHRIFAEGPAGAAPTGTVPMRQDRFRRDGADALAVLAAAEARA